MPEKLVGLTRVSTGKQELSGLGLEGQRAAIEAYRARVGGVVIREFREIESGTHQDVSGRPVLMTAVRYAIRHEATLVIAKIDRLVRSKRVFAYLKESRVRFIMCDLPHANELTIDILVAVAEDEARRISERTKTALRAYRDGRHVSKRLKEKYDGKVPPAVKRARAGKLGSHLPECRDHLTQEGRQRGGRRSAAKRRAAAIAANAWIADDIKAFRLEGLTYRQIADRLNARDRDDDQVDQVDVKEWSTMKVKRILDRLAH
jgi:DNA invertase Pin-like site-specific DNA recombinase